VKNPYNVLQQIGVSGARTVALPLNYSFDLNMDTWWSAVQRARLYSDFTGLDALYSYVMKSSTLVRAAIDKRLRPLRSRTFGVYVNGVEDTYLTDVLATSPLVLELIYQRGLANFTFARVIGVNKDCSTYVYPLRNLDVVNKAIKRQTYDTKGDTYVDSHVNLFWLQTSYQSEDTLGLLEPICRDYINMSNAQNNWQTASQFLAYQQMMMYYESGDEEMLTSANKAAEQVGLGKVIVSGKTTDEISGKVIKDFELENVYGNASADTFRIFKENIEQLRGSIMQLILGSTLLGMSEKNTNSERLVRAHLKLFRDICESDAVDVQSWFNTPLTKRKLAYLLKEPKLETAIVRVKPANYIDIGDIDVYTKMLKDLELKPCVGFVTKAGLDKQDVIGYEKFEDVGTGNGTVDEVRADNDVTRNVANVVMGIAKRFFNGNKSSNGAKVER